MSTLITGGTVVTADGNLAADVLVVGEKIAAVLARGEATDAATFAAATRRRTRARRGRHRSTRPACT